MEPFTKDQIKEIVEQFDCGFRAFYHKTSRELIFVPNSTWDYELEANAWQNEFKKLKKNPSKYQEIHRMQSRDSFRIMADFAEQVENTNLQTELFNALNRRHPFREFKAAIDYSTERQNWFDFKNKRSIEWTEKQLEILEETNRPRKASR